MKVLIIVMTVCVCLLLLIWAAYRRERFKEDSFWINLVADLRRKHEALVLQTACCPSEKKQFKAAVAELKALRCRYEIQSIELNAIKRRFSASKGQITKLKKRLEGGAE